MSHPSLITTQPEINNSPGGLAGFFKDHDSSHYNFPIRSLDSLSRLRRQEILGRTYLEEDMILLLPLHHFYIPLQQQEEHEVLLLKAQVLAKMVIITTPWTCSIPLFSKEWTTLMLKAQQLFNTMLGY